MKQYGSVTYEEQTYKTVEIGTQVWMAKNLNYAIEGSRCYEDKANNCTTYGRLYDWETAMTACPDGWRLPSDADWNDLMKFVNPSCLDNSLCADAGTKLKARNLWSTSSGYKAGTDDYGFAALPGGYGTSVGNFYDVGSYGLWWSATEDGAYAYYWFMRYYNESVNRTSYDKSYLRSVRCVKEETE